MRRTAATLLSLTAFLFIGGVGCASSSEESTGEEDVGSGEANQTGAEDRTYTSYSSEEVWIFGGSDHDTLLGCVTCSDYSSDSVLSSYGRYGSTYSSESIYNSSGRYGSTSSSYSPWNEYSSSNPKLYTKDKKQYFGIFTINKYRSGRTRLTKAIEILDKGPDK
jgi:hypothetical protein